MLYGMREEQIHIPVKGSMAFARLWHSRADARGTVILVHGAAEHSLRYQQFALFLAHNGYNVVAYDQRGHGYTAISSSAKDDPLALKKQLYDYGDFGYVPADEGWSVYLDDLSQVLDYVYSRYQSERYFLFGHSMGAMVVRSALATLPPKLLGRLTGVIISAHPENGGLLVKIAHRWVMSQIRKHGDETVSEAADKLILGSYNRHRRFSSQRTGVDWISSVPEEVDAYIADPLCGNVLRLGFYAALTEANIFVYSRQFRKGLTERPLPLLLFSGTDDPVTGFGRTPEKTADFFRKLGWDQITTKLYEGCRHEVFHDRLQAEAFGDCLAWMNRRP
jgi:alpha-beta hydrolase superfamily lysophospholipase